MNFNCSVSINDISSPNNKVEDLFKTCGNGSNKHIFRCQSKRCKFQFDFLPSDRILSTSTKRFYDCIIVPGTVYLDCHSANVIYLITCSKCFLQYVGETAQKLNERFNLHITGFRHPKKHGHCRVLTEHFTTGKCKGAKYTVQIIEKLEGNGRTERGGLDAKSTQLRKQREVFYMNKLRTVYPYGLNDLTDEDFKKYENCDLIGVNYFPLTRPHPRISRGQSHKFPNTMSSNDFFHLLNKELIYNLPNAMNFIRISIASFKKKTLKELGTTLIDKLNKLPSSFPHLQWYLATQDAIESKLYKPAIIKPKRKPPDNICKVFFHNKAVELINLPRILHHSELNDIIDYSVHDFKTPTVVYDLTKPIRSEIFNFKQFVENLNVDEILCNPNSLPCPCANSPFLDKDHGHVLTGNLRIVNNNKLRKILSKGPKFRETRELNFCKARESIVTGINDCITKWSTKNNTNKAVLQEWKNKIFELVDKRIETIKGTGLYNQPSINSLKETHIKSSLKQLQNDYILTPIDKANGNIAFICKRFYALTLLKELGIGPDNISTSYTYEMVNNVKSEEIVKNHENYMNKTFNISLKNDDKCLPSIYWLPKLHKKPTKSRFIIAAPKCSMKPLSKAITKILKLMYTQIENYNKKCHFFSGVKTFWTIQNNTPVINSINSLNKRNKASSVSTFDFSTLYTNIPHDKLLSVLNELVEFCFKGSGRDFITVDNYCARWTNEPKDNKMVFSKSSIKKCIKYLLNNCFFKFGDKIFKQVIGIPMGSDPAPFMANLFLYSYESKWVLKTKKCHLKEARMFGNTFRFIDDLIAINDGGLFEKNYNNIYPEELKLKKENNHNTEATFLDLSIHINSNNNFDISLFDKRDGFPFSIVRMPFLCSNMPTKMFYSSLGAEVLRIARANNNRASCVKSCKDIVNRMLNQGGSILKISNTLKKIFGRHFVTFQDFAPTSKDFVDMLLT